MTDYPNKKAAWKKRDTQQAGRKLLAIIVFVLLFMALVNGFLKTISFKKYLGGTGWDGKSSFVSVLGTDPPAVLVFQQEPKRIALFKLDSTKYYISGNNKEPLVQLSRFIDEEDAGELVRILSVSTGVQIENYMLFANRKLDRQTVENDFKDFASPATPLKILTGNFKDNIMSTNISQKDFISLWWQAKDVSISKLEVVDLTAVSEEVVLRNNQKVLGVDEESLHFKIAPYLENTNMADLNVTIENTAGNSQAVNLASQFVQGVGFTPTIVDSENSVEKTRIIASDNNYPVKYLAKIFDCDIVLAPKQASGEIKVILGSDFATRYLK